MIIILRNTFMTTKEARHRAGGGETEEFGDMVENECAIWP